MNGQVPIASRAKRSASKLAWKSPLVQASHQRLPPFQPVKRPLESLPMAMFELLAAALDSTPKSDSQVENDAVSRMLACSLAFDRCRVLCNKHVLGFGTRTLPKSMLPSVRRSSISLVLHDVSIHGGDAFVQSAPPISQTKSVFGNRAEA